MHFNNSRKTGAVIFNKLYVALDKCAAALQLSPGQTN